MRRIKNALILAGGDSTRFWPLSEKTFFTFLGKPLIMYQIEELAKYSANLTIIANNSNAVAIKRLIDNSNLGLSAQVVIQKDTLTGQAGAIYTLKNLIKGEIIIVNANDVIDYSIIKKIAGTALSKYRMIFVGKKQNEYFPGGYLRFDKNKELIEIVEKPKKENVPSDYVKLMADYYSDFGDLIKALEQTNSINDDHYEQAINYLLSTEIKRDYFIYDGYWRSLKYPWHVLTMLETQLSSIKKTKIAETAEISKNVSITGPVIIEDGVRIGSNAKIVGPSYIGRGSVISDFCLVRNSEIGEDCLIGSYTEVARSYIGNKVFLHRNYIGDSVLDDGVMFGAQAVTANLRFDGQTATSLIGDEKINTNLMKLGTIVGKKSKIGVNSTLTPGVKVGVNCLIMCHEIVRFDLEDDTYLIGGEERENTNK
ncbi:MAG: Bifunctional protein GlmU [Candidatus Roizmanbacteria bacterium GW2011_GWA2_35_8]|uniref:Bifunctional protein GlmU n=1 Tax=Candidatus Roizmanbacteria bacterium GW2011_GWA2_35_8 TaxID=1618479 RepID=A0A0G0CZ62_9BACT|nr:MAG: Bifunctional protein GlmU [Candidatus Roizmanbacteria bacterium GW2011_GWA2_35_8]